ncbi:hypothetical protein GCK72_015489 [Caenorhabditis remanei]|uniref:Uncharacterized protein n=1 Tax=Caenorhabditis remanei TaxID=31234 RepID=A0A6A5GWV0_CAERE|nr:hypothetical protein GCK72_015489 [Caenorhabditis remanei]KAF1759029.1 hypothetical protein GCK72_015489 [Caenorhabditis remanei]
MTSSEQFRPHGDARRPEDWTNQGQYHILVLNRAHTQRFTEFPVEVNMFAKRWSLVAFVEYVTKDNRIPPIISLNPQIIASLMWLSTCCIA